MPSGIKGWIILALFAAAVWFAWSRYVANKVS